MIDCPRCGFSQPKDRYCANCGVDMDSYKPKLQPIHQRFLNNPFSYVGIMAAILLALVAYIQTQPNSKFAQNIKSIVPIVGKADPVAISQQELDADQVNAEILKRKEQQKLARNVPQKTDIKPMAKTPAKTTEEPIAEAAAPVKIPGNISVQFIEISQNAIGDIMAESLVLSESSDMQSMVFNSEKGPSSLNKFDSEMKTLPGGKSDKLNREEPLLFSYTYPSEDGTDEYGLTLQFNLLEISPEKTSIEVESFINFPASENSASVNSSASGSYQFDNNKSLILAGLLPRAALSEEILNNLSGPLNIYSSESFFNAEAERPTEIIFYIQMK